MPGINVIESNRVYLGGHWFKILGPVQIQNITSTPNPVLFGDTTKRSETQVMAQLTQSDNTGGAGIYKGNVRTDTSRHWKSRANTMHRQTLCLPPLTTNISHPAAITTEPIALTVAYRNEQYWVWAAEVFRWVESTSTWSALERTLGGSATEGIVFNNKLYIAYGSGYDIRTNAGVWSAGGSAASYWVIWDNKLWKLYEASGVWTLAWSTDGTTWTTKATFPAEVIPSQMAVYRDAQGATVIWAATGIGYWTYDSTNDRWLQTEVQFPQLPSTNPARMATFKDGKLYGTTGGLGVISMQQGNPMTVTPMGLDRDDGVPQEDAGRIIELAQDFNWLIALLDASSDTGEDDRASGLPSPLDSYEWSTQAGPMTVRAWNGGWHVLYESTTAAASGRALAVSSAYDLRRLYFGIDSDAYYQTLSRDVFNPRQRPTATFATGPVEHITPWWDYGAESLAKVHGHIDLWSTRCTATETIAVYYGTDLDDNTWTLLGTITTNGLTTYKLNGPTGLAGRWFRFKFVLSRGGDSTTSPILEYYTGEALPLLPATYGFNFTVVYDERVGNLSPSQQRAAMRALADPRQTAEFRVFAYQDTDSGTPQTYYGRIFRMTEDEYTGREERGLGSALISFVAPHSEDAI